MKRIEELGISGTPWAVESYEDEFCDAVVQTCAMGDAHGTHVCNSDADAKLISAAPELYDCLYEAVRRACVNCADNCGYGRMCSQVARWKRALAKAGGIDDIERLELCEE